MIKVIIKKNDAILAVKEVDNFNPNDKLKREEFKKVLAIVFSETLKKLT